MCDTYVSGGVASNTMAKNATKAIWIWTLQGFYLISVFPPIVLPIDIWYQKNSNRYLDM
jgi:hypothetical protein